MKVRPAILSEAPTIAKIGTSAFADDPSYGHFYPWRTQYPKDFYRHLLRKYRKNILTPGELIMVVELEDKDDLVSEKGCEAGKIIGFATLRRSGGTKQQHEKWNAESVLKKTQRSLLNISEAISSILRPNRAVCKPAMDDFWNDAFAVHATTKYTGKLDFLTLAVLPDFQRCGLGGILLEWAGYKAALEGIPCFGDATAKGLPLYLANGCKQIGLVVMEERTYEKTGGGRMPVLAERLETPVLRWDAENVTTERLEKAAKKYKFPR